MEKVLANPLKLLKKYLFRNSTGWSLCSGYLYYTIIPLWSFPLFPHPKPIAPFVRHLCTPTGGPAARPLSLRILLPSHDSPNPSGGGGSGAACVSPSAPCRRGSRPELKPADAPPSREPPPPPGEVGLRWEASQGCPQPSLA
jgi:hypothetical protein